MSCNGDFLSLATQYNSFFGSFARKTKIQPLDDIDIIIGLSGCLQIEGYEWNNITLKVKDDCSDKLILNASDKFTQYWGTPIYHLNSNKVKNKLSISLKLDNSETKFPERAKHSLILKYLSFKSFFIISSDSKIFIFLLIVPDNTI